MERARETRKVDVIAGYVEAESASTLWGKYWIVDEYFFE